MTDFTGKHGLIVGVANKRSISWAIAQAVARRGARLALTYQGRFEEHVNDLSQGLEQSPLVLPCDVSSDAEIACRVRESRSGVRRARFHRAWCRIRSSRRTRGAVRQHDARWIPRRDGHLRVLAHRADAGAMPLLEKRGSGSVVTLSYLGSQRVFPNYNVMGVAKAALEADRALSGRGRRPERMSA